MKSNLASYIDTEVTKQFSDRDLSRPSVTLCGHFALTWFQNIYSDHLEISRNQPNDFSRFCLETWDTGCLLAKRNLTNRLLVLVNDWQFVGTPGSLEKSAWEKTKQEIIASYFQKNNTLPQTLLRGLQERDLDFSYVEKNNEESWMFSEFDLRKKFGSLLLSLNKDDEEFSKKVIEETVGSTKRFSIKSDQCALMDFTNDDVVELLHSGSANCIGEVVYLLKELSERNVGSFINIYPKMCVNFVNVATLLTKDLLGELNMDVLNIGVPLNLDLESVAIHAHTI